MTPEHVALAFLAFCTFLVVVALLLLVLYCPPQPSRHHRRHMTPSELRKRVQRGEKLRLVE